MFNMIFFSQQCHKYKTHHCLFSLTSPANAHIVHCPDPWPVPEKLFLPLAQTTAQLSSNPSPHLFFFPLCYWTVRLEWEVSPWCFVQATGHICLSVSMTRSSRSSQPSTLQVKLLGQISTAPSLRAGTIALASSLNVGNSGRADFHPCVYDAIPPHQPVIGKHSCTGGLAERSACCAPACCTVTPRCEVLVGSWKGKARGARFWWSLSVCLFQREASPVVQTAPGHNRFLQ